MDRGLDDVLVSNGEHVARTGPGGSYPIAAEEGVHRFIFFRTSAGYRDDDYYSAMPTATARLISV